MAYVAPKPKDFCLSFSWWVEQGIAIPSHPRKEVQGPWLLRNRASEAARGHLPPAVRACHLLLLGLQTLRTSRGRCRGPAARSRAGRTASRVALQEATGRDETPFHRSPLGRPVGVWLPYTLGTWANPPDFLISCSPAFPARDLRFPTTFSKTGKY